MCSYINNRGHFFLNIWIYGNKLVHIDGFKEKSNGDWERERVYNSLMDITYTKSFCCVWDPLTIALNSTPSNSKSSGVHHSIMFPLKKKPYTFLTIFNYRSILNGYEHRMKINKDSHKCNSFCSTFIKLFTMFTYIYFFYSSYLTKEKLNVQKNNSI